MKHNLSILAAAIICACSPLQDGDIVIDNSAFSLVIGNDASAKSLKIKATGEQMLPKHSRLPLFSVTQRRPFNNEVKLEFPNTRTTYDANSIRRNGDTLFVGFETAPYEAVVTMNEGRGYVTFTLEDFTCNCERDYHGLSMDFPCGINVALSQYRVIRKFDTPPIFTEGAAKSHFGWHFQAGANAFDAFKPEVFKDMILRYPYAESFKMKKDMTRVDFGWWRIYPETTPEMWDFADAKAAECNCPVTIQMDLKSIEKHPQADELLSVLKKWEDYRRAH